MKKTSSRRSFQINQRKGVYALLTAIAAFSFAFHFAHSKVNLGSDISGKAFNPTMDTAIGMADHRTGVPILLR